LLSRLQSEMGFTPAARVRLATPMRDDEADDFGTGWDTLRKLRVIDGGKE
jgi:phage terminase small subunit